MDTEVERPRWRFNIAYRATDRLQLGLEYNPVVSEVLPVGNYTLQAETEKLPFITIGTSSDRIFTPEGNRAYYITFAKTLPGNRIAPYIGVSYSEFEERLLFPMGVNLALDTHWDALAMMDGRKTHFLLTYKMESANITAMAIDLRRPKFGLSLGFGF